MTGIGLRHLSILVGVTLLPLFAFAENNSVARIDNAAQIDEIVQYYQAQCDEEQASVLPKIDEEDTDKPKKGVLTLAPDSVYDIQITPSGKQATALVPQFHCSNIGHAWCGSGGCGFYLIVDGTTYFRQGAFSPTSVTFEYGIGQETVVLFATHGTGCKDAGGKGGVGSDSCYSSVVWSEERQSFFSIDGSVDLWKAD
ncbi:hypothetical protein [Tabrizicola sp.]|uniref:hypothetical protein n=1 Tax=Tabrizicola sp. TaxID=2005166 RepID=UPI003D280DC4